MGVWSPDLYGNDVTADLKHVFRDLVRLPLGADDLIHQLTGIFPEASRPEDEMSTSFWLATADLLHTYGIDAPLLYTRVLDIIDSGSDVNVHRELGLSERDLQRRARNLQKLAARLSQPSPKPRNRRLLLKPEAWIFDEGAFVIYPTKNGQPINPYMPRRLMVDWVVDGWGAFVVLGRDRMYEFFAVYLIAVLPPLGPSAPDVQPIIAHENTTCVTALVTLPSSHPRKMRLRELGVYPVKQTEVASHFIPGTPPFDFRPQVLANALYMDVPGNRPGDHLCLQKFVDLSSSAV